MANAKAIDKTIALMWAVDPAHFNMATWVETLEDYGALDQPGPAALKHCGTVMCLAGFAVAATMPNVCASEFNETKGRKALGLATFESKELFRPESLWVYTLKDRVCINPLSERDPARGIAVLLHLRNTGEVDWRAGYPEHFKNFPALPKRPTTSLWDRIKARTKSL